MRQTAEETSVVVEPTQGGWKVRVDERDLSNERDFARSRDAEDFAHGERLRLGILPQQDMS